MNNKWIINEKYFRIETSILIYDIIYYDKKKLKMIKSTLFMKRNNYFIINNEKFYCGIINTDMFETLQNYLMDDPSYELFIISNM